MKFLVLAALATATPAVAQDAHAGHAGHAGHAAPSASAPAAATAASAAKFNLDTPLGELMANAQTKAVVDSVLPGMDKHPSYEMAKGFGLRQIAGYAGGAITPDHLAKIEAGLAAVK